MFEHIHFLSNVIDDNSSTVKRHKDYKSFADKNSDSIAEDSDFHIQGSTHFLLSRPLPDRYRQNLLYLQTFCYMEMGTSYFTERKNYYSFLLVFTHKGQGFLLYEGKEYTLQEGDVFLIDCRRYHYYRTQGERWEHSDLHIGGNYIELFYEEIMQDKSPVFHCKQSSVFQQQLEKILRCQTGNVGNWAFFVSHEIENMLFLLTEWMIEEQDEQIPENISMLRVFLEHHFQKEITLDDMAKFAGVSKYHLCRQFKKYIGFSPKEYVLDLRISQAKMLLQTSDMPGCRICTLVGFANEANFIRQFKNAVNMTPGEYRKQLTLYRNK